MNNNRERLADGSEQIFYTPLLEEIFEALQSKDLHKFLETILSYYPELSWLTGDVNSTPEYGGSIDGSSSLGEYCFPNLDKKELTELDRTITGILVLKWLLDGDYESFTECQNDAVKLSKDSFNDLKQYFDNKLQNKQAVTAMITYIVINDLTKITSVVGYIKQKSGIEDVDHDKLLYKALKDYPEISPSFLKLDSEYQELILNGLSAEFNLGQFIQGENVAANLESLHYLDKSSLDFYIMHTICDIAGAAGHIKQNGTLVMTEPTYKGFKKCLSSLEFLGTENSETVYDTYLSQRADDLNLYISNPTEKAITRVCCMMRYTTEKEAQTVKEVFESMPDNIQAILCNELNKKGTNDGIASLIYYAPAILVNLQKSMSDNPEKAIQIGLKTIARIFQEAKTLTKNSTGNGVFTIMADEVASIASKSPEQLENSRIHLEFIGSDAKVNVLPFQSLDVTKFNKIHNLREIPGENIITVGMGGGSDCLQAAQLGNLLKEEGKEISAVISVRNKTTTSQGKDGRMGEDRTPENATQIYNGVFLVENNTEMRGRAVEKNIVGEFYTILILKKNDVNIEDQLEYVKNYLGNVDTIVGVDTGGDALYSIDSEENDSLQTTPEQDLQVLQAINNISGVNTMSTEIAVGTDMPDDGETKLLDAGAHFYNPSSIEIEGIISNYKEWGFDGSDENNFGKTPLAWIQSLKGNTGVVTLNIPSKLVLDTSNPRNPFVCIQKTTQGVFFMKTEDHLSSIK